MFESVNEALKAYKKGTTITGDEAKKFAEEIQKSYKKTPYGDRNHQVTGYFPEKTRGGKEIWTAFDNFTNEFWTESFKTEELAKKWVNKEIEVDDLTYKNGVYERFKGRKSRPIIRERKSADKLPLFEDFRKHKKNVSEGIKLPTFDIFLESKNIKK